MELTWCDNEMPLEQFLERFKLPQIVQIGEGAYGETEDVTLSRGQELHLHLLKDTEFYSGVTEAGEEVHIPLNSPHKVIIHTEKSIEMYHSRTDLSTLFPQKYKHVRLLTSQNDPSDHSKIIEAGEIMQALFFDKDMEQLVCIDKQGCEITLKLSEVKAIERSKEGVFMAEVDHRFSLPLTVEFIPQPSSSAHLHRGLINLRKNIIKQTVVATSRDEDCKCVLTFPGTLDVTVIAPDEETLASAEYRSMCENPNIHVNFEKIKERIDRDDEIYDDVKACVVKAIPYAEAFFKIDAGGNKSNTTKTLDELDDDDYVVVDRNSDDDDYEPMDNLSRPKPKESSPVSIDNDKKKSTLKSFAKKLQSSLSRTGLSPTLPRASPTSSTSYLSDKGKDFVDDDDDDEDDDNYEIPVNTPPISPADIYQRRFDQTRRNIIKSNRKFEDFSVQEVRVLLNELNLGQYAAQFQREQVDGKMLKDLDQDILQSHFSMTAFHALKLKKAAVDDWRPSITNSE